MLFAQTSGQSRNFDFPDLTHTDELIALGGNLLKAGLISAILLGALGGILAWMNSSYGRRDRPTWLILGLERYGFVLRSLQHVILVGTLLILGFFLCTTLANRYHHWEQSRLVKIAQTVAGDRLEHMAPQARYLVDEPYTIWVQDRGRPVELERTRKVSKTLNLAGSQIQVKLSQVVDPSSDRLIYQSEFQGDYQIRNLFEQTTEFSFDAPPPSGYSLLQNYRVEREGQRLRPPNPGDFGFPVKLSPGETATLRVSYRAQGASRWVYNANGQLLSNFKLTAIANFPNADFASGIIPAETKIIDGGGTQFTWVFEDNVAVQNPFGVFTATQRVRNTGLVPRLLLLAPGVLLWWILLLYWSMPLRLQDALIASALFFGLLLALTYGSRVMDARLAWGLLSPVFLALTWGLGRSQNASLAAIVATLSGAIVPVLGLMVPYTGLTLSLAGLMSVVWLAVRHWYQGDRSVDRLS